jgi:hypothetical protein
MIKADPEVLHLRTSLSIPAFSLAGAPQCFDRKGSGRRGLRVSSSRFDRMFGEKVESRLMNQGLINHVKTVCADDTFLRELFGAPEDTNIGLCQFLWALDFCESDDGEDFLPSFGEYENVRLLAYIRANTGQPMAAEAVRIQGGFKLDVFKLDEVETWDERTFLLSLANPRI